VTNIQKELMEVFEEIVDDLGMGMDFTFNKNGYADKLTVIAYSTFVRGVQYSSAKVLSMVENTG